MSPYQPKSPGHFDRFNFCNAAPGCELEITIVQLGGNAQAGTPFVMPPMSVDHINVCSVTEPGYTDMHIEGNVIQGGTPTPFHVSFPAPNGGYLNNVVFGVIERCADGETEAVLFGEAESTAMGVTEWTAMQL